MAKYDIVLYGATGFTGQLTASYLSKVPELQQSGRSWAIAGRTLQKLEDVRASLTASGDVGVLVCDLSKSEEVAKLVQSARVVLSAAGPYYLNGGAALLGECARQGVHYSDLSGEGWWQRQMIDDYHSVAISSGARIVLAGGVDSIPSDLGTMLALDGLSKLTSSSSARADDCSVTDAPVSIRAYYTRYSGAFSGGTINTMQSRKTAIKNGTTTQEALRDPYILAPGATQGKDVTVDGFPAGRTWVWDGGFAGLTRKFFMAPINARVVRRSLALKNVIENCSYMECASVGFIFRVAWLYVRHGFGYFVGEPVNFSPKSGEGPPSWCIKKGGFQVNVVATDAHSGREVCVEVAGRGDPGYGATSKMFAEVGLGLAFDEASLPKSFGVLTPWIGMGYSLVERLRKADAGKFMTLNYSGGSRL